MMPEFKFEKLEVWRLSLELSDYVYQLIDALPHNENFNLKDQIRRAVTSISLNIAEGSVGTTNAEQMRFLRTALRSTVEVVACLKLMERRGYCDKSSNIHEETMQRCNLLFAKLSAFIKSLKTGPGNKSKANK